MSTNRAWARAYACSARAKLNRGKACGWEHACAVSGWSTGRGGGTIAQERPSLLPIALQPFACKDQTNPKIGTTPTLKRELRLV